MYKLKHIPEDFVVKEISAVPVKEKGKYIYLKLLKKNRNTLDVVKEIAKQLHIPEKEIGFAGNKDKRAVTEQIISVKGIPLEKILKINIDNITLTFLGYGNIPISLGDLEGNYFEIVARNLENQSIQTLKYCENYFDEQRFGKNNAEIGKQIVQKNFKEAAVMIENEKVNLFLQTHKNDYIGALQKLPARLLRMYINAYQSYLWNETVAEYLRRKRKVIAETPYSLGKFVFAEENKELISTKIPLVGFGSEELIDDSEVNSIIADILKRENLDYPDFIIKQIPAMTLEGELRNIVVEVQDLKIEKMEEDDLNLGKQKVKVTFSLPKGSYATMIIRKIISGGNPHIFR